MIGFEQCAEKYKQRYQQQFSSSSFDRKIRLKID